MFYKKIHLMPSPVQQKSPFFADHLDREDWLSQETKTDGNLLKFGGIMWLILALLATAASLSGHEACETLPSSIHIIKEIYTSGGILERTCEGEVAVSKCEGSCPSKVRPSAVSHSGFYKDCQCCRETGLRVREVILSKCYDADGQTLSGDKETFTIKLREPADCKCSRCGEATISS